MDITKPFWSLIVASRFYACFLISRFIQLFLTLFDYISVLFVFHSRCLNNEVVVVVIVIIESPLHDILL